MEDFLDEKTSASRRKRRLPVRLFLLTAAVAVLLQCVSFLQAQLGAYSRKLAEDFKVILVVKAQPSNEVLTQIGETLSAKEDIVSVKLFSPNDALSALEKKNPQLADALLLMGKNKMPAYYELTLNHKAASNADLFVGNLAAEYKDVSPKYNQAHAQMLFYTGLCYKFFNMAVALAVLLFLGFMFLVEAYPAGPVSHAKGGAWAGVLAGVLSVAFFAVMLYPAGVLQPVFESFTSWERQLLLCAFCGLFGWTLSKWQKF